MRMRSLLYVPASAEQFIAKAHERKADAIILDMEDAVAAAHKEVARQNLAASIRTAGQSGARVFVRINAAPEMARLDVRAAFAGGAFGLYVAKASVEKLREIDRLLSALEGKNVVSPMRLVALIEDAEGVLAAAEMAGQKRLFALSLGSEDFATSLGARPDPDVLRLPKQMLHYAAKVHGLMSFGLFRTVAHYSDLEAIEEAAREARRHGFDGASCVHPGVVPVLNRAFSPDAAEISWARRILAAAAKTEAGAFSVEGKMVDLPVLTRARRILEG